MTEQGRPVERGGVVVGFDGSRQATVAVEWAADEAARRGARLGILHAAPTEYVGLPIPAGLSAPLVPRPLEGHDDRLKDARLLAAKSLPEEDIDVEVVRRNPAPALLAASKHAELVVVGSRGHGAVASALMGSVSTVVAEHAACPVVVVRGAVDQPGRARPVTVGVDGSQAAMGALGFAADVAARRGVPLRILCGWSLLSQGHWGYAYATDKAVEEWAAPLATAARHAVDEAAEEARRAHPELVVQKETPEMVPSLALEEASRTSDLVVVGARGVGVMERALLGSVSRAVLHHAACPIAVVRH